MAEDDVTRTRERIYPPDNKQERLAQLLLRGNGQTVGDLPDFIDGLLLVGRFDPLKNHRVAIDRNGQQVMDPNEAVLIGQADPHQTMEFMLGRLATIQVAGQFFSELDENHRPRGKKEELMYLWSRFKHNRLQTFEATRSKTLSDLKDRARQDAWNAGGMAAKDRLTYGEGEHYERYKRQREEIDKKYLEQLKSELSGLKKEFDQIPSSYPWEA